MQCFPLVFTLRVIIFCILSCSFFNCSSSLSVQVFESVMSWVNRDPPNRHDYMPGLVEHVRLPLLSRDFLVQRVEEEPLIKSSSSCKDFLIEAMKYHLLPKEQRILIKNPRTRQRTPIGLPKVRMEIYSFGNQWFKSYY